MPGGAPDSRASVLVFPVDRDLGSTAAHSRAGCARSAQTDGGMFAMDGLPPGE